MSNFLMGRRFALDINSEHFNITKISRHISNGLDLIFISPMRKLHLDSFCSEYVGRFSCEREWRDSLLIMLELASTLFGPVRLHDDEGFQSDLVHHIDELKNTLGIDSFDGLIVDLNNQSLFERKWHQSLVVEEILHRVSVLNDFQPRLRYVGFKDPNILDLQRIIKADSDVHFFIKLTFENAQVRQFCIENDIPLFENFSSIKNSESLFCPDDVSFVRGAPELCLNTLGSVKNREGMAKRNNFDVSIPNIYSFCEEPASWGDADLLERVSKSFYEGAGYIVLKNIFVDKLEQIQSSVIEKNATRWGMLGSDESKINKYDFLPSLICDDRVITIIDYMLGWGAAIDNIAFTTSYPNAGQFGPHNDSPFDRNPGSRLPPPNYLISLQCLYCLDDFCKDNGTFFTLPGTQALRRHLNPLNKKRYVNEDLMANALCVEAEAGDVIIAIGNAWHGAFNNMSNVPRKGLLVQHVSSIVSPRDDFDLQQASNEVLKTYSLKGIEKLYKNRRNDSAKQAVIQRWMDLTSSK